jgi:uncharacterized protein
MVKSLRFLGREEEQRRLRQALRSGGFRVVTGRRRVGKTALLRKLCDENDGLYHQAVEGTAPQQLLHLCEEVGDRLSIFAATTPPSWSEFFKLLARERLPRLIVLDEFPYLTQGDAMLPSLLQKWVDHELPKHRTLLVIAGSSQSMMDSHVLRREAPLYGRAILQLHLQPLSYDLFCRAFRRRVDQAASFSRYSLVGGVPQYWQWLSGSSPIEQAERLFFQPSVLLAQEPVYSLREEGVTGTLPKAILDLIGRGVSKLGKLAARLNTSPGNLSRPLALLLELGLIQRELPFGETERSSKRTLYRIDDPALAFYYGIYLPQRSRWFTLSTKAKASLLELHTSRVWETFCRQTYPGSRRYWESQVEIDLVAPFEANRHLVAECKWQHLSAREEAGLLQDLKDRFARTALVKKLARVEYRILSKKDLRALAYVPGTVLTNSLT